MITSNDMIEIEQVFLGALDQTISRYLDPARLVSIQEFLLRLTYDYKPVWMMTPVGVRSLIGFVFESDIRTDFIQSLTFNFMSRCALSPERYDALASVLAAACSIDKPNDVNATPGVYQERLTSHEDAYATLKNNKWMVSVLLVILYVNLGNTNDKKR